jgi:hypothetical protein
MEVPPVDKAKEKEVVVLDSENRSKKTVKSPPPAFNPRMGVRNRVY